ncbi:MAG TPA: GerW family sporulation protein [Saprospiraceae bacterium]|nr:GerW family sporulation protein [Saprospiraceae bacterium]HMP23126.1 GerW family sporulation protein [Saprospiraceae bacterium]
MKVTFEEMIPQITDFLKSEAKTETIIGAQFQLGEFSCVPVIRLGMGFGTGGGEGEAPNKQGHGGGAGAAGGIGIEPIGFLVSKDDQISFIATRHASGLSAAFEKVPDLIAKYLDQKQAEQVNN